MEYNINYVESEIEKLTQINVGNKVSINVPPTITSPLGKQEANPMYGKVYTVTSVEGSTVRVEGVEDVIDIDLVRRLFSSKQHEKLTYLRKVSKDLKTYSRAIDLFTFPDSEVQYTWETPKDGPSARVRNFREALKDVTLPTLTTEDGVTSSNFWTDGSIVEIGDDNYWWFGWDTKHGKYHTKKMAEDETIRLLDQIKNWTKNYYKL